MDYETLSNSSKNFGSQKTYKGGRRPKAAAPLCMFFSHPKLFILVLKSRIFSFQSILACRGSQKLHFGDLGLTQTGIVIFNIFYVSVGNNKCPRKKENWYEKYIRALIGKKISLMWGWPESPVPDFYKLIGTTPGEGGDSGRLGWWQLHHAGQCLGYRPFRRGLWYWEIRQHWVSSRTGGLCSIGRFWSWTGSLCLKHVRDTIFESKSGYSDEVLAQPNSSIRSALLCVQNVVEAVPLKLRAAEENSRLLNLWFRIQIL